MAVLKNEIIFFNKREKNRMNKRKDKEEDLWSNKDIKLNKYIKKK